MTSLSQESCQVASENEQLLENLVASLSGRSRKSRQEAARLLASIAAVSPQTVAPYAGAMVDALDNPEAQTRWEMLDALSALSSVDPELAAGGLDRAEECLFDDGSGSLRVSAFGYLTSLGCASPEMAARVWPTLDEAIQCYHGDQEFGDMLGALYRYAQADLDAGTRRALVERMSFDARNPRSGVGARAAQIIAAADAR